MKVYVRDVAIVLGIGLTVALLNGLGWVWFVREFVALDVEIPGVYEPAKPVVRKEGAEHVVSSDVVCVHCPRFSMLNRGVLGGYAPIHFELLAWLNVIPLYLSAAAEEGRYGIRIIDPRRFAVWCSLQWVVVVGAGFVWRDRRSRRPTVSEGKRR